MTVGINLALSYCMYSEKTVKNYMRSLDQYCYIDEDENIQKALVAMNNIRKEGKDQCLVVLGAGPLEMEIIKGFVTPSELVFGLLSHFLKGVQRSGPIFWEGQLETECLEGVNKRVGEIMLSIKAYVRENEMLMEAVFLLNKYKMDFLPVVRNDEVVGIIHLDDILKEICGIILK
ncbi:MAG: CBS domain-containing protein [Desulfobacteraceae bacterium]|nr:CBS domain-containing protein [Desulfobacteraceae bacterium]MBC2718144.1 CBS domain-containing protein [Desulfobacteraceae bacterium]